MRETAHRPIVDQRLCEIILVVLISFPIALNTCGQLRQFFQDHAFVFSSHYPEEPFLGLSPYLKTIPVAGY
jgi:hypothetical protein